MSTTLIIFPSNFLEFSNNFEFSFDFQHRHAKKLKNITSTIQRFSNVYSLKNLKSKQYICHFYSIS